MISIRHEQPDDIAAVRAISELAFTPQTRREKELGRPAKAGIVDAIRSVCPDVVSLVAVDAGRIVGHIFFSPVFVSTAGGDVQGMGLAPMAVLPERQRQGIGSRLVRAGIDAMRERGCPFVIVVGHPEYYPRFGFIPASGHGLSCQWNDVPDEAFMVLVLNKDVMSRVSGVARYRDEFDQAM
jgi:putative acetyltransferase